MMRCKPPPVEGGGAAAGIAGDFLRGAGAVTPRHARIVGGATVTRTRVDQTGERDGAVAGPGAAADQQTGFLAFDL
ncbi:hypothetical protein G6F53_014035 [Rhizopus delemar]|nr:hypothetical protein G6F53_014035 [Rhizopus delemar]